MIESPASAAVEEGQTYLSRSPSYLPGREFWRRREITSINCSGAFCRSQTTHVERITGE